MKTSGTNPIIVALDVQTADEAASLVHQLSGSVHAFKVGLELFNAEGPEIFSAIRHEAGNHVRIFYDAKFNDIPNTVAGAVKSACKYQPWMLNIHASGGSAMMKAAVKSANEYVDNKPLIIAVTVLTSIDTSTLNNELGVAADAQSQVVRLAKLAKESGCDGVVASPLEVAAIRDACGPDFVIVTPGVRPAGADIGDQKRVMTPADAVKAGSTYLVIGRPITGASDPRAAAEAILAEI